MNRVSKLIIGFIIFISLIVAVNIVMLSGILPEHIDGYRLCSTTNTAKEDYIDKTIYTFTLDNDKEANLVVLYKNMKTDLIDLKLLSSDGSVQEIMHGEIFFTNRYKQDVKQELKAGKYSILLNCRNSKGKVLVFEKDDN